MIKSDRLKEMLSYNPEIGLFTWLDYELPSGKQRKKFGSACVGSIARYVAKNGYVQIRLERKLYYAHRLVWFYVHGVWPIEIDHKNGITSDNRLKNLRLATRSQQCVNSKFRIINKVGLRGVDKYGKRYRAYIGIGKGKTKYIGTFDTAIEAHNAYMKEARELYGEFVREL